MLCGHLKVALPMCIYLLQSANPRPEAQPKGATELCSLWKFLPACAGLRHLSRLARLRVLVLWNCMRLSVDGLAVFARLPGVTDLSLRGCAQLPDGLCSALAHLRQLRRLNLQACERFTGACAGLLFRIHRGFLT